MFEGRGYEKTRAEVKGLGGRSRRLRLAVKYGKISIMQNGVS